MAHLLTRKLADIILSEDFRVIYTPTPSCVLPRNHAGHVLEQECSYDLQQRQTASEKLIRDED